MGKSDTGPLKVGDRAPDFILSDQNGNPTRLSDYLGKKTVVLAFFIKAFTAGCTRELRSYQAELAKFDESDVRVIGISVDSPAKNKAYAESLRLTYPILSDYHRTVCREYGVLMPVIRLAKRVTFVVDKQGLIQSIQRGGHAMDPENSLSACALANRPRVNTP
jgi:peroxiredoxin